MINEPWFLPYKNDRNKSGANRLIIPLIGAANAKEFGEHWDILKKGETLTTPPIKFELPLQCLLMTCLCRNLVAHPTETSYEWSANDPFKVTIEMMLMAYIFTWKKR